MLCTMATYMYVDLSVDLVGSVRYYLLLFLHKALSYRQMYDVDDNNVDRHLLSDDAVRTARAR